MIDDTTPKRIIVFHIKVNGNILSTDFSQVAEFSGKNSLGQVLLHLNHTFFSFSALQISLLVLFSFYFIEPFEIAAFMVKTAKY